ncbi:MAG: MarR family transcriptional regulator [Candidatus Heimdallarchaeota archaeon]|nr:MarR family transcriptional regulator [Candidatus Heimdallarchaeota archaeon]
MSRFPSDEIPLLEMLNVYARASRYKVDFPELKSSYTLTEIQLFRRIHMTPGLNIMDLSKYLGVSKGLISRTISEFAENGVVRKESLENNKKEVAIYLTELGIEHMMEIRKMMGPLLNKIFHHVMQIPEDHWMQVEAMIKDITLFFNEVMEKSKI